MSDNVIFVFGSNLAGRHGKGAAQSARIYWGAVNGVGVGFTGNSYAIPTKDEHLNVLPLDRIKQYVDAFIKTAETSPELIFILTPIGCGLAGYKPEQIAPMFKSAPKNVYWPKAFIGN